MIIIEGPDNAGKSTLANQLGTMFKIPVVHSGGPGINHNEIHSRVTEILEKPYVKNIRDRFPVISDYIYSEILRNGDGLFNKDNNFKFYMDKLLMTHPLIILCWPTKEKMLDMSTHQEGLFDKGDHFKQVNENQPKIVARYEEVFKDIPHYKYTWGNSDFILPLVKNYLDHVKAD